jgi:hypothetical protein
MLQIVMREDETSIVNATSSGSIRLYLRLTRQVLVLLPRCSLGQFLNWSTPQCVENEREKLSCKNYLPLWERVARIARCEAG